jgi:hypothetical protein
MVETKLFVQTFKSYGLATVRCPMLGAEAKVEAFEKRRGFTPRVFSSGKTEDAIACAEIKDPSGQ